MLSGSEFPEEERERIIADLERLAALETPGAAAIDEKDTSEAGPRSFRFAPPAEQQGRAGQGRDDVADGIREIEDVASRGFGVLGLGVMLSLEGLMSPIGVAFFVVFAALLSSGQFGNSPVRFSTQAPSAADGTYYKLYDAEVRTDFTASDADEAVWPRLRGGSFTAEISTRRRSLLVLAFVAAIGPPRTTSALPAECLNGLMEQRQYLGLDPFAPPCEQQGPGPLPIYPILAAQTTTDQLLENELEFRTRVRLGLPTGSLQLPPSISYELFTRIGEARPQQASALLDAAKEYTRDSYDANELYEFATKARREGRSDAEVSTLPMCMRAFTPHGTVPTPVPCVEQVSQYVDGALSAARRSATSLRRITALLPTPAEAGEARWRALSGAAALPTEGDGALRSILRTRGGALGGRRLQAGRVPPSVIAKPRSWPRGSPVSMCDGEGGAWNTDPYEVVGVRRGAPLDEVRAAYRRRARSCHPDTSDADSAAAEFRELVDAFIEICKHEPGSMETHPLWIKLSALDRYWSHELGYTSADDLEEWLLMTSKMDDYIDEDGSLLPGLDPSSLEAATLRGRGEETRSGAISSSLEAATLRGRGEEQVGTALLGDDLVRSGVGSSGGVAAAGGLTVAAGDAGTETTDDIGSQSMSGECEEAEEAEEAESSDCGEVSTAGIASLHGYRVFLGNEQWLVRWAGSTESDAGAGGRAHEVPAEEPSLTWEVYSVLDTELLRREAERIQDKSKPQTTSD